MIRINVLGGLYVTDDGRPVTGAAGQPRRLALLALLAEAGDLGITRDTLLGFLWPEADEERGRRALAQALYALRRDLGSEDVISGVKDLRLNTELASSDLGEFREAAASGNLEKATDLFRGSFLEGFHLPGADTFERWVEERRGTFAHQFADLLDQLAERARARGDHRAAVGFFRRLAGQDPLNTRIAARLMEALAAQGDVSGAIQHARVYETLVRQELDLPPDREVIALAERLRKGGAPLPTPAPTAAPAAVAETPSPSLTVVPTPPPDFPPAVIHEIPDDPPNLGHTSGWAAMAAAPPPHTTVSRRKRPARWIVAGAITLMALVILAPKALVWANRRMVGNPTAPPATEHVIAVGRIVHYGHDGNSKLGQPLADMLATNLARSEGSHVVSSARMYELQGQMAAGSDSTRVIIEAARQAGATELVDGSLYETPTGYRLDLRRTDLRTGAMLKAYTVEGADLFVLADSGTKHLASDVGGEQPVGSLADVSTRSLSAYRAYEEGLRAYYYSGDTESAEKHFLAALKEDSTFVMAAFFSGIVSSGDRGERFAILKRAVDLANRASDRDRLIIRATWAFLNSSPSIRPITDTLMVRYPGELEGFLWSAQGALLAGDYAAARPPLHTVIAQDSLGFKGKTARCLGCEAMNVLVTSYTDADSLPGAIKISRLWTRLQPTWYHAWRVHAMTLAQSGYFDSAYAALRKADSLNPTAPDTWRFLASARLSEHKYGEAEEIARVQTQTGPASQRTEGAWVLGVAYRQEGRFREALAAARKYRAERVDLKVAGATPFTAQLEGQVLFELGRYRESAALFDSTSRIRIPFEDSSLMARNVVWAWTHMATARAAAGDTAGLATLADSMQRLGQISGMGRDRRLHHYVRGLLYKARGQLDPAIEEFRKAILSPNMGYARISLELAMALNAQKRWLETIPVMQASLRGVFEGSNLYATHTEYHYQIGRAFEGQGQADSARAHYALVIRALSHSDPEWVPMRTAAEAAMARFK
jgi:DNA-binding SARP family transcriptional activator/Tfp pilus assembly protein PilF